MICFGEVPASSVLPIFFDSYAGSTGASVTLTGLAVTDIEVYKGASMTQRASDAGYTLLDTDGIDIDGVTGIHGFSIDLGDNTDAGFYAVGSFYTVVVSAVTIDTQTVNFVAATFRIKAAEAIAGKAKVDVDAWLGTAAATPTVAGVPEVDLTHIAGSTTDVSTIPASVAAILVDTGTTLDARIPAALVGGRMDASVGAMAANVITAAATAADFGAEVADAVLDRDMSTGTDSGSTTVRTPRQALRAIRNKSAVAASTLTVYKEDDATASWTAAVTGTAGADPITAIDPAGP